MSAAGAVPDPLVDAIGGHLLLERVASGDRQAFATLYDTFVAETYAICLHNLTNTAAADKAMARTWLFIWSNAAALNEKRGSTKTIVLSTAWAVTSERSRSPLRRLTRKAR